MTSEKAPGRAWLHFDACEYGRPFEGWWHVSEGAAGQGLGEYIRADVADAMVAELKAEIARLKEKLDGSD